MRGRMRMARGSQGSAQALHSTPWKAIQVSVSSDAFSAQGARPGNFCNAAGVQASVQSAQNRHSPWLKSTCGKPPRPLCRMPVGQALRQSPQRVQRAVKNVSSSAQGGREGLARPAISPRKNCILLMAVLIE
jgi:hypothetical protein